MKPDNEVEIAGAIVNAACRGTISSTFKTGIMWNKIVVAAPANKLMVILMHWQVNQMTADVTAAIIPELILSRAD